MINQADKLYPSTRGPCLNRKRIHVRSCQFEFRSYSYLYFSLCFGFAYSLTFGLLLFLVVRIYLCEFLGPHFRVINASINGQRYAFYRWACAICFNVLVQRTGDSTGFPLPNSADANRYPMSLNFT